MTLSLNEPALLFPAIAILMLGYINRYIGTAGVIRSFKRDYDTGYAHTEIAKQMSILKRRIELSRLMLLSAATALLLACLAMFFVYANTQTVGQITFGVSILAMIVSILLSLYETSLSNKSLIIEIDDVLNKEK